MTKELECEYLEPFGFDDRLSDVIIEWSLETHGRTKKSPNGRIRPALRDAAVVDSVWFPTDPKKYAIQCWVPDPKGTYMMLGPVSRALQGRHGVVVFSKKGNMIRIQAPFGDKAVSSGGIGTRVFRSPLVQGSSLINKTGLWLVIPYFLFGPNTLHLKDSS